MFDRMYRDEAFSSKSERLQLDRLLTVTERHEYIALAFFGLLVLLTGAWMWSGSVARSVVIDGVLIDPGVRHELVAADASPREQVGETDNGPLRAVAWAAPAAARHILPGQEARVEIVAVDGTIHSARGEIAGIRAEQLPGRLAALLSGAAGSAVDIALDLEPGFPGLDGEPCAIRIFLSRQAPVSLLFPGR